MLVEQQMQRVEGVAAHEPVVLLVERMENLGVGQHPVESLARVEQRVVRQPEREMPNGAECLHLPTVLVQPGL